MRNCHAACELLRERLSHLWHLSWVWHSWLTLELSSHSHRLRHTTSSHWFTASLASSSSHAVATSLRLELLLILTLTTVATWNTCPLCEWLSTLVGLSRLLLRTNSHVSNSLDDLVKNLMDFSVFLGFSLLLDLVLGQPQFHLKRS